MAATSVPPSRLRTLESRIPKHFLIGLIDGFAAKFGL
jgi:hypothetical protein